ncbi:Rieske 2Fe-2S domain-containing protein [Pseudomonas aeruginosa]
MSEYIETDDASYFRVRRQAYVSAELHRRELHEIFDDSWLYAAHLSELREPGDFITRDVGGRNLIIQRRADGEPAVYLNACAHRGAKVCAERQGNSQRFTCPYHGWTYDSHGSLIGLPDKAAYQHAGQCHPELSLTRVKHAVYRNFLFIHYAARQPSLETYLGQAKDYIDLICDQSEAELEIIPGGFEHSIKANWKLLAENGVDAYHLPFAHKRYLEYLNTLGTDPESHKRHGRGEALGNGHALIISGPPSTGRPIAYWSPLFPEALKPSIAAKFERLVERFGQARAEDIAHTNKSLFIFPNLVINDILGLNIRSFFPTAADEVSVTVWGAGFADETREERAARINGLISFIGPGGFGTPTTSRSSNPVSAPTPTPPSATAIFPAAWDRQPAATSTRSRTAASGASGAAGSGSSPPPCGVSPWPSEPSSTIAPCRSLRAALATRGIKGHCKERHPCVESPAGPTGAATSASSAASSNA